MHIQRTLILDELRKGFRVHSVVALFGPRQCGKTTIANFYSDEIRKQDIPNLGINIPANTLRKFWNLLAHYHGNILNSSELGRAIGVSHTTVKKYLEILVGTFMIRELKPWHENISKRQVKQSKIYFRDAGIYHYFLGVMDHENLQSTPKIGASWEGFALEETIRLLNVGAEDCYFWATHQGAELDLLITKYGKKLGFEYKYKDAPRKTKSMQIAIDSLNLDKLYVVYPGKENYKLDNAIEVININTVKELSI